MPAASPYRPRGFTPPRPWAPLSDAEWGVLLPHVARRAAGRQVGDLRARMDAIFHMACRGHDVPWRDLPPAYGKPDTVSRFFRRVTHAGLWHHLLEALARADLRGDHPLLRIEHYVVRACRRAARLGGLRLVFLIKRLGRVSALNAPSWVLPDLRLSELARRHAAHLVPQTTREPGERAYPFLARARRYLRDLKRLHRMAGGRARIPRALRLVWP